MRKIRRLWWSEWFVKYEACCFLLNWQVKHLFFLMQAKPFAFPGFNNLFDLFAFNIIRFIAFIPLNIICHIFFMITDIFFLMFYQIGKYKLPADDEALCRKWNQAIRCCRMERRWRSIQNADMVLPVSGSSLVSSSWQFVTIAEGFNLPTHCPELQSILTLWLRSRKALAGRRANHV